jgi:ABC-type Fe3+ transport system permease subunit
VSDETTNQDHRRGEYARRALWSLVFGAAAFFLTVFCVGPIIALPAIAFGWNALNGLKRTGGVARDIRRAKQGMLLGFISIIIFPVFIFFVVSEFAHSKSFAKKNSCINNLRLIDAAKRQW